MMTLKLEDYIAEGTGALRGCGFPRTMGGMIDTGFHEWGFVIYRCVYGDDELWKKYMDYFVEDVIEGMTNQGGHIILPQYANWTVMEDKETLDGASINAVREKFLVWREQHKVEVEVPWHKRIIPLKTDPPPCLPRFTFCLCVDQKCLDTLTEFAKGFPRADRYAPRPPPLTAILIDGDFVKRDYRRGGQFADEYERGQYPSIGGCTSRYVGWEYISVSYLTSFYDRLHSGRLNHALDYKRPPLLHGPGYAMAETGLERI